MRTKTSQNKKLKSLVKLWPWRITTFLGKQTIKMVDFPDGYAKRESNLKEWNSNYMAQSLDYWFMNIYSAIFMRI